MGKSTRTPVLAAGGIVVRDGSKPLVAVVQRRRDDAWVLPKGKLKPNERPMAAAKREATEETGYGVRVREFLGVVSYFAGSGPKIVHFWRMRAIGEPVRELSDEIKAVEFLPLPAAIARLTLSHEKFFLRSVGRLAVRRAQKKPRIMPPGQVGETARIVPQALVQETARIVPPALVQEMARIVPPAQLQEAARIVPQAQLQEAARIAPPALLQEAARIAPPALLQEAEAAGVMPPAQVQETARIVPQAQVQEMAPPLVDKVPPVAPPDAAAPQRAKPQSRWDILARLTHRWQVAMGRLG
jgi:8-oxo-dGTP diphosphatase